MKQKCAQFHTAKSYPQTLNIFKKEGFEIIIAERNARIDIEFLTIEEQISWLETLEKHYKDVDKMLKKDSGTFEKIFERLIDFRKQTKDLVKLYKTNPSSYKTSEKYEQFIKTRTEIGTRFSFQVLYFWWTDYFQSQMSVRCSYIIAKKNSNIVRYLSFETDPIVTLIGPKAKNLKSYLEKKF